MGVNQQKVRYPAVGRIEFCVHFSITLVPEAVLLNDSGILYKKKMRPTTHKFENECSKSASKVFFFF